MRTLGFDQLKWEDAPMPGGSGPVRLARLPDLADGAFRAFVHFPAGWSRPALGHYEVAEEVFVLEGDLTFNSAAWRQGCYAWIPPFFTRFELRTATGATVLAWFSQAPRWRRGAFDDASRDVMKSVADWHVAPLRSAFGHAAVHTLRSIETDAIVAVSSGAIRIRVNRDLEALRLSDRTWLHAAAGETVDAPGESLLRLV